MINYRLTSNQKHLLKGKIFSKKYNYTEYIKMIFKSHVIEAKGKYKDYKDCIVERDLYKKQIEYILKTTDEIDEDCINKFNIANYYFNLAKTFNNVANDRKLKRNELWEIVKKNIICTSFNKTELRIHKYMLRGDIIPSPKYVNKMLNNYDELPTYLSITYLDEIVPGELTYAYERLKGY